MDSYYTPDSRNPECLLKGAMAGRFYEAQAEDILTDDDMLDLFRIVKQILRKKPDTEKIAKLLFCITYALGDHVKFTKQLHEDRILFRDAASVGIVQLPNGSASCCQSSTASSPFTPLPSSSSSSSMDTRTRLVPNTPTLAPAPHPAPHSHSQPHSHTPPHPHPAPPPTAVAPGNPMTNSNLTPGPAADMPRFFTHSLRPPAPFFMDAEIGMSGAATSRYPNNTFLPGDSPRQLDVAEVLMEPKQRGFYYQDGRIGKEPALLQRYAEQGVLTQASLMRKRKRQLPDPGYPYELSTLPASTKKPKIPHRHGEFEQRRKYLVAA